MQVNLSIFRVVGILVGPFEFKDSGLCHSSSRVLTCCWSYSGE